MVQRTTPMLWCANCKPAAVSNSVDKHARLYQSVLLHQEVGAVRARVIKHAPHLLLPGTSVCVAPWARRTATPAEMLRCLQRRPQASCLPSTGARLLAGTTSPCREAPPHLRSEVSTLTTAGLRKQKGNLSDADGPRLTPDRRTTCYLWRDVSPCHPFSCRLPAV
jgi:hypothetical protein